MHGVIATLTAFSRPLWFLRWSNGYSSSSLSQIHDSWRSWKFYICICFSIYLYGCSLCMASGVVCSQEINVFFLALNAINTSVWSISTNLSNYWHGIHGNQHFYIEYDIVHFLFDSLDSQMGHADNWFARLKANTCTTILCFFEISSHLKIFKVNNKCFDMQ